MRRCTIRWRLTIWNTVVLTTLFVIFSGAMLSAFHQHLTYIADQDLKEELRELTEEVRNIEDEKTLVTQLARHYSAHSHYQFQITDAQGRFLFRSRFLTQITLPESDTRASEIRGPRYSDVDFGELGRYRMLTTAMRNPQSEPILLQVFSPRAAIQQEFHWYLGVLLTTLPIVIAVSIIAGYLLARRALIPIEYVANTAERISVEKLDQRLEILNPNDELGRLAITLNGLFDRIQASYDQMRQFTSDAAHELRSPIAALRTQSEVALRSTRSVDEYQRVVSETLQEVGYMGDLVDQLLLLSRHDAGYQSSYFEYLPVDKLLLDVIDRARPVIEERGQTLVVSRFPLWSVMGDDIWLSQLFWNLLDNASKYTLPGGEIHITAGMEEDEWWCSIRDTGVGIAPAHLPRIFDRFYRVDISRTRNTGGTGLGLAICKSIVEAHRGRIHVESVINEGTIFTVHLPGRPAVAEASSGEIPVLPSETVRSA